MIPLPRPQTAEISSVGGKWIFFGTTQWVVPEPPVEEINNTPSSPKFKIFFRQFPSPASGQQKFSLWVGYESFS